MHIKQVSIKNYRNFGDTPFVMELRPFTLILGENNIGKTNLLNALGLIFSQELTIFRKRVLEIDDINYGSLQAFKRQVCDLMIQPDSVRFPEVRVEVVLTGMNDDQEAVVADWFIDRELTEAKIQYVFSPRASFDREHWIRRQREEFDGRALTEEEKLKLVDFPIGEYRYSIFGCDDPSNECNMYFLRMLKMEFLDALRDAQRELMASGDYRLLYRILAQRDTSQYDGIKNVLYDLDDVISSNPNLQSIKQEVSALLDKVSLQADDADNTIDFSFTSPETAEMLKKISMIYGSNPIAVARNGLGRNNLLYISLVLSHLSARDSAGGDTHFRLIAIEEPEAHLHPHLEDHLAENIESILRQNQDRMQLLLTSHSTHIAAKLSLENTAIIYNNREEGRLDVHYVLSGLSDARTVHYLSKYLDATKSRMFFARKILLVEGIAEQLLIPRFYELHCGSTVERRGCNVINVCGVAFRHFLKVIGSGFFVRCVVFTDSDTGTKGEQRARALKREFDQRDLILVEITDTATFETDLIEANKRGPGKQILLDALKVTRPRSGAKLAEELGVKDIDVDAFYEQVNGHKSEFAFNLLAQLEDVPDGSALAIPEYVRRGFEFLG